MPGQSRYHIKTMFGRDWMTVKTYREACFWASLRSPEGTEVYTVIGGDYCDHVIV